MEINLFLVDAFTEEVFKGNPAAVCIADEFPKDELMQSIAKEINLSATAFVKPIPKNKYFIRWFTPDAEVELCGHGTLASAFVLFEHVGDRTDRIVFNSLNSGKLVVEKDGDWLYLDFPQDQLISTRRSAKIVKAIGAKPVAMFKGKTDYLLVFDNEDQVNNLSPDMKLLSEINTRGFIVTSKGEEVDFVSRFFAPNVGINEDPVTGSAHTSLIPYWVNKLGKDDLIAKQLSPRGGYLKCQLKKNRVIIGGQCRLFMNGIIQL